MILLISLLLLKLEKESPKSIFLLGDFNINLLKYEISDSINNFIDTFSSNFLLPLVDLPTRISKTSALIDNIFSNLYFLEETNQVMSHQHSRTTFHNFFFLIFFLLNSSNNVYYSEAWLEKFESSKFIPDFNQINLEQIL